MKKLSRRAFLQGTGGALFALPAMESLALAAPAAAPAQRLAVFYVPIGVVRRSFFPKEQNIKTPKFGGPDQKPVEGAKLKLGLQSFPFAPTLKPLEKVKQHVTLVTGMDRVYQNGTDVHAQCGSCFLTSAAPYAVKSSAWPLTRTLDHLVADKIGTDSPFRTLEFSCNSHKDNKESIYFDNISWYGTGHLAPSMRDPRKAYERLFSVKQTKNDKSITDLVLADANSLKRELGSADQQKFAEYFDAVRAIELRMEKMEKMAGVLSKVSLREPPASRMPRGEYIRLMGDLMITAFQTGLTNVSTFMVGPERWDTPYMFDGLFRRPMSHHQMSHNQHKHIQDLEKVDKFHMEQFVYLVERMASIKEANGTTLLDNMTMTYGSGLGDGATHQYNDLPIIVAGGAGGRHKGGQHLHLPNGTPLANLWLTQANLMGLKRKAFADSTGEISDLFS